MKGMQKVHLHLSFCDQILEYVTTYVGTSYLHTRDMYTYIRKIITLKKLNCLHEGSWLGKLQFFASKFLYTYNAVT